MDWTDKWPLRHALKEGQILYHGTSRQFPGGRIEAPLWLSDSKKVARWFALRFDQEGRVLSFKVKRPIHLPEVMGEDELRSFGELFCIDVRGAELIRETIPASPVPGWFIPANYPSGSDILLCSTRGIEFIEDEEVEAT